MAFQRIFLTRICSLDFVDPHAVVSMLKAICLLSCKNPEYNQASTFCSFRQGYLWAVIATINYCTSHMYKSGWLEGLVYQSLVVYISKSTVNDYCFNLLCIAYILYGIRRKNDHISLLSRLYRTCNVINT